ncbi:MAG: copper resistance protein CopC [Actinomycetes bacterium]
MTTPPPRSSPADRRPGPDGGRHPSVPTLLVRVLGLVLGLGVLLAAPAAAHTDVVATEPVSGATTLPPPEVRVEFSGSITAVEEGIRVTDAAGGTVPVTVRVEGTALHVDLPRLPFGEYLAAWRVVAADGHPITGEVAFTVRGLLDPPAGGASTPATPPAGATGSHTTHGAMAPSAPLGSATPLGSAAPRGTAGLAPLRAADDLDPTIVRWRAVGTGFTVLGLLVLAGAALAGPTAARDAGGVARRVAVPAALLALLATVATAPAAAAVLVGAGPASGMRASSLGLLLTTPAGTAGLVRVGLLCALLALLAVRGDAARRARPAATVLAVGAALTLALSGHSRTEGLLASGTDAVHLLAGAAWLGGLVVLAVRLRVLGRARPVALAQAVAGFSRVASVAVGALVVSGVALGLAIAGPTLFTDPLADPYGRTLAAKTAAALGVVAVGAYNHRRLVPRVTAALAPTPAGGATDVLAAAEVATGDDAVARPDDTAGAVRTLARTVLLELVGLGVVVALTSVLVDLAPR